MGSDDDNGSQDLLDQQYRQNQAELEAKRQNLFRERLEIIKSQGAEDWVPDRTPPSLGGNGNGSGAGANFTSAAGFKAAMNNAKRNLGF